jgi:hypothetical protein
LREGSAAARSPRGRPVPRAGIRRRTRSRRRFGSPGSTEVEQSGATFLEADVTSLGDTELPRDVRLFLDIGCFHDLPDQARRDLAEGVTELTAPGSTLLLLAFQPGKRGPLPGGADHRELEATFDGWNLVGTVPAVTDGMPRPLEKAAPSWYRMQRV